MQPAPTNRLAILSLVSAVLTVLSFCIGFAPFLPYTAVVCYPAAVILGLVALLAGTGALRQIRSRGERGRASARIGVWTGALTILAVLVFTALTILLVYYGADFLRSAWPQPNP